MILRVPTISQIVRISNFPFFQKQRKKRPTSDLSRLFLNNKTRKQILIHLKYSLHSLLYNEMQYA